MDANVVLIKCTRAKKLFGVRIQLMDDGDWWRTWAFKIDDRRAKNEHYDTNRVVGNLFPTEEYPGCPYCESNGLVQCGNCQHLSCWHGEKSIMCDWCETLMTDIVSTTDKIEIAGNQF